MKQLIFWKPAMQELLEAIQSLGHELGAFDPTPLAILPNHAEFSTEVACQHCGAFLDVLWSPFDNEGLTAHGSALEVVCTSVKRQPAA